MNKKVQNQLRRIAGMLPPVYLEQGKHRQLHGHPRDKQGQPMLDRVLVLTTGLPVNHYRRMKDIYEKQGAPGVKKYVDRYKPQPTAHAADQA